MFSLLKDELTKSVQVETPWYMMFTDDMALVDENTTVLEGKLEHWWEVLKINGLKISRAKTEFLEFCFNNTVGDNESDYNTRLGSQFIYKVKNSSI